MLNQQSLTALRASCRRPKRSDKGKPSSLFFVVIAAAHFTACVPVKDMVYFQPGLEESVDLFEHNERGYRLQKNDILDVKIASLNPEVNALFNASSQGITQSTQASVQTGGDLYYITGYSIDQAGDIDIPFVGKVAVAGLTLEEAYDAIDLKVNGLFSNYHLQVKLGGVRFSALGEFNAPGKHVVMQNQVTILEALALCGDLSAVANRSTIKLIRQYPEGTRIHELNLLEQELIGSPLYFIQPNDVIYAEPLPQRAWGVGVTGAQTLSTVVGTLSTSIALILSILSLRS